ncbi:ADP-ribose pyrophosphatase YjhB (NUDIX family) [Albidovulum inexpectatum]|uniref:ADP-ribose pyrophosphatase YjhB (NUDIX family) n=1 Tax=Albidovulum inexpectatum TaxID=196587 RepID=A0A2S5JLF7_9RHOB|nr:NUDIX domain-containing protein [Albidovulum inexpectatum]PPB82228.1 ADP-ribose pyrophosphatase YjhB (NUDIX family) [Albidovulum inexpectatum]
MELAPNRPRLAVRAIILHRGRLLLVNAWPNGESDLWCAPGGGAEPGVSLPDNLRRELCEECGLQIDVGPLALVNEFHDPASGFHQVELFFRCTLLSDELPRDWCDPSGVVSRRHFFTRAELSGIRLKPGSLARVAFDPSASVYYDPLETMVR